MVRPDSCRVLHPLLHYQHKHHLVYWHRNVFTSRLAWLALGLACLTHSVNGYVIETILTVLLTWLLIPFTMAASGGFPCVRNTCSGVNLNVVETILLIIDCCDRVLVLVAYIPVYVVRAIDPVKGGCASDIGLMSRLSRLSCVCISCPLVARVCVEEHGSLCLRGGSTGALPEFTGVSRTPLLSCPSIILMENVLNHVDYEENAKKNPYRT